MSFAQPLPSTVRNAEHRMIWPARLMIFMFCLISMGGFRLQLAGIDPTQSLQNFRATYILYVVDMICLSWAIIICFSRFRAFLESVKAAFPLTLLPLLALASAIVSPDPEGTAFEAAKYASSFLVPIAAVLVWQEREERLLSYEILKFIIVLSLAIIALFPKYGIHGSTDITQFVHAGSWRGVFGHRTDFAYCCAVLVTLSYARFLQTMKSRHLAVILLAGFCLYKAGSGGALITASFSIITITAFFLVKNEKKQIRYSIAIITTSIISFFTVALFNSQSFLEIFGEDSTFTGRIPLWNYIIDNFPINYIYGLGYVTGFNSTILPYMQIANFNAPNAQGAYVEALIAFGVAGPLVIVIFMLKLLASVLRFFMDDKLEKSLRYTGLCLSASLFFLTLPSTIAESYMLQSNKILVGLCLIMMLEIPPRSTRLKRLKNLQQPRDVDIASNEHRLSG